MGQPPITAPHPLIHFPPRFPDCSELRSSRLPDAPFLRLHGAGRSPLLLATAAGFVGSPPPPSIHPRVLPGGDAQSPPGGEALPGAQLSGVMSPSLRSQHEGSKGWDQTGLSLPTRGAENPSGAAVMKGQSHRNASSTKHSPEPIPVLCFSRSHCPQVLSERCVPTACIQHPPNLHLLCNPLWGYILPPCPRGVGQRSSQRGTKGSQRHGWGPPGKEGDGCTALWLPRPPPNHHPDNTKATSTRSPSWGAGLSWGVPIPPLLTLEGECTADSGG